VGIVPAQDAIAGGAGALRSFPRIVPPDMGRVRATHSAYQAGALEEIGAFRRKGETFTPEALCKSFGIPPTYSRLMHRWMDHLAEAGMLNAEGSEFRADRPLSSPPLDPLLREASEESKAYPEFYEYVQSCGPRLASVLTGKQSPSTRCSRKGRSTWPTASTIARRSPGT